METLFSRILSRYVADYVARTGVLKQEIAARAGYTPAAFSHLLAGRRAPRSRASVLQLAQALELGPRQTSELLIAAGYEPALDLQEAAASEADQIWWLVDATTRPLGQPERDLLAEVVEQDLTRLLAAWRSWVEASADAAEGRWRAAARGLERGLEERYLPLRRSVARHYAYLSLLEAEVAERRGDLNATARAAEAARAAAAVAEDRAAEAWALTCLGVVERRRGHLAAAVSRFQSALALLAEWGGQTPAWTRWATWWRARVLRHLAATMVARGEAEQALPLLEDALRLAERSQRDDERARLYFTLGSAHARRGDLQAAQEWLRRGLALAEQQRDREEPGALLLMLEGWLALAEAHLERREVEQARGYLERAEPLVREGEASGEGAPLSDAERYYLLAARLARQSQQPGNTARSLLQHALALHLDREPIKDPARLAALYNEGGLVEMAAGNPQAAVTYLEQARRWAGEAVPEDRAQKAAALVSLYAAQLALEERPELLQPLAEEAEAAGWAGPYWQHLARLELERARAAARRADGAGVLAHVGSALDYAARIDRQLAGAMLGEAALLLREAGESERVQGMAELVERLGRAGRRPESG